MRQTKVILAVIGLVYVLCPFAIAAPTYDGLIEDSECCLDPYPLFKLPGEKDREWFDKCRTRINVNLAQDLNSELLQARIQCTFLVEPDGNLSDLFVWKNFGKSQDSNIALKAISDAAPFLNPPPEFVHKNRFLVTISRGRVNDVRCDARDYKFPQEREYFFRTARKRAEAPSNREQ